MRPPLLASFAHRLRLRQRENRVGFRPFWFAPLGLFRTGSPGRVIGRGSFVFQGFEFVRNQKPVGCLMSSELMAEVNRPKHTCEVCGAPMKLVR